MSTSEHVDMSLMHCTNHVVNCCRPSLFLHTLLPRYLFVFKFSLVCGICICSHSVQIVHASHPRRFSLSSTMGSNLVLDQSKIPAALEHFSGVPIAEASAVLKFWQVANLVKSVFEIMPYMKARHPLYAYLKLRCVCRKVLQVTHVQIEAACSALFI